MRASTPPLLAPGLAATWALVCCRPPPPVPSRCGGRTHGWTNFTFVRSRMSRSTTSPCTTWSQRCAVLVRWPTPPTSRVAAWRCAIRPVSLPKRPSPFPPFKLHPSPTLFSASMSPHARHLVFRALFAVFAGYGDITPVTNNERTFAMFLMLSGGVFFGCVRCGWLCQVQCIVLRLAFSRCRSAHCRGV
jgi:hypothetical protein